MFVFFSTRIPTCTPSFTSVFHFSLKTKSSSTHLCARAGRGINQALPTKRMHWRSEYKPGSTHEALKLKAPLHVISEIWLLLQCAAALQRALYEADALEQCRPCTRTSATTSNFYSHILKKWSQMHFGRSLEPCDVMKRGIFTCFQMEQHLLHRAYAKTSHYCRTISSIS